MLLEVVYHWSRPPPWSHQHGFSDLPFSSKDDRRGKFTTIYGSTNNISLQAGELGLQFFDFSVLCRWFWRKNTQLLMNFNFCGCRSYQKFPPHLYHDSIWRCRKTVSWLFSWQNLLSFFCSQKINGAPVNFVQTCIFVIHTKTNKKINPPQKFAFESPVVNSSFTMGSMAGGRLWEKTIPLFGASIRCIRRLRGWIVGTRGGGWSERWD